MRPWRRLALSAGPSNASMEGSFCSSIVATTAMVRLNCWYDCRGAAWGQYADPDGIFSPLGLVRKLSDSIRAPAKPFLPTSTFPSNSRHQEGSLPSDPKMPDSCPPAPSIAFPPGVPRVLGRVPLPAAGPRAQRALAKGCRDSPARSPPSWRGRQRRGGRCWPGRVSGVRSRAGAGLLQPAWWRRRAGVRHFEVDRHWASLGPDWGCQYGLLARDWLPCEVAHWDLCSPGCCLATLPLGGRPAPSSPTLPLPQQRRHQEPH